MLLNYKKAWDICLAVLSEFLSHGGLEDSPDGFIITETKGGRLVLVFEYQSAQEGEVVAEHDIGREDPIPIWEDTELTGEPPADYPEEP